MINKGTTYFVAILLILGGLLSISRIYRSIDITFSQKGAKDFNTFWYYGNFIRQGEDPYSADLKDLKFPISYLDGKATTEQQVTQGFSAIPAYPAFMWILLSPFAFFSWQTAKIIWMVINLALMFLIPPLVLKLYPKNSELSSQYKAIFFLTFWSLLAISNTIGNGQTSLLVFALSLIALLTTNKNKLVAGLALGVALSKYSLSFPFFLFLFLFKKEFRVIAIAISTQIFGFICLSLLTKIPFLNLLHEYYSIVITLFNQEGINLEFVLSPNYYFAYFLILVLTFSMLWSYWSMTHPRPSKLIQADMDNTLEDHKDSQIEIIHLHVLTLLSIWTLLSIYHREYDAIIFILFVALILFGLINNYWDIHRGRRVIIVITVVVVLLMSRPGAPITNLLPTSLTLLGTLLASNGVSPFALLISFCMIIWLSFKLHVRS